MAQGVDSQILQSLTACRQLAAELDAILVERASSISPGQEENVAQLVLTLLGHKYGLSTRYSKNS